ncbi:uncharacterized protein [Montipora foliosa]|uniref:uncharacterized protein n=1 Tax=Montipora foliosa TaxID=591990 RepID=UPI0035F1F0C6
MLINTRFLLTGGGGIAQHTTTPLSSTNRLSVVEASQVNVLSFNTRDCNSGKGCFSSPEACTTSENCNFLITFNATNSNTVLFELSGVGDWVAVGFSDNQLMADTDLLMCVRGDGSRSGHYYASSRATPQQTTPTPLAVTVIEQVFDNGRMKCRVSREINPGLNNFKDLNMELFLIGGYGPVNSGGGIAQHTTTPLPSTNRLSVVEASQVNVLSFNTRDCNSGKGCFSSPEACTTSENCNFLITFNATNSNTVLFELSGVGDWVAVGFSDNQLMADTDLLMCVRGDGSRSGHYYASSRATPQQTTPTPLAVTVIEQVFENGRMKCRVSREVNPGLTNFKDLNMELFLIGGYGPVNSGGGIAQHTTTSLPSTNRLSVVEASQFNTRDCNSGKGCFSSPESSTTSKNCNFLLTFNATKSSTVLFELSGVGDWVAVGFSDNQLMADTDLLICVRGDGSRSGHYYASSRATPQQTTPTPSAVTVIEQVFDNGRMKCRVSREINPGLTNFKDLNMELFLIGGYGPVNSGGGIAQHTTTPLPSTNRLSVVEASQVNVLSFNTRDCNSGKGCFSSPESYTSSENCNFLITFNATNSNTVLFELSGVGDWVAVGFSDNQLMADTDLLMCVRGDGSRSGHYYSSSRATPQQTTPTPSAVTVMEQVFDNGRIKCRVSREVNPGLTNFKDLNMELFLIGGYGPVNIGGGIAQHTTTPLPSTNRLRVPDAVQVIGDSSLPTSILVHGMLMAIAWTGFAFVGLFTARYMRKVWEPTEIFGKKAWFTVHRLLMTTTVSLTIAGTIVIFVHVEGWSSGAGAHPICGIIAISLAVIQPIMAAFRPAPDAPKRRIFNWTHRLVGIVALIMAVVTIYLGLDLNQVGLGKPGLYAVIIFFIGVFLILVFEFYLIMSKCNKAKKIDTRDIPMHPPGYEAWQQPEMAPKEAMLRKMMFAFVTLLGFSVTLTIILLLALKD